MAKVKFPLEMANGTQVRTIEELKENFDLKKVLGYFLEGKLLTWLEDRYYDEEAEKLTELKADDAELSKKISEIFEVEYTGEVNVEKLKSDNERIEKIMQFTDDENIIKNFEYVAFNQEELADLYDKGVDTIYLCEGEFKIPLSKQELKYVTFGDAKTNLEKKKNEAPQVKSYYFETKDNYVLNETNLGLNPAKINSEGKPYNLKVKALYKINRATGEEKLVSKETDNIDTFIAVSEDRVIYTVEGKKKIYMHSPSGFKSIIFDGKDMDNIKIIYADNNKVLWESIYKAHQCYFIEYYGESYNLLLSGEDYGDRLNYFVRVSGECAWFMIKSHNDEYDLYAVDLKKTVSRHQTGMRVLGLSNFYNTANETVCLASLFLENVQSLSFYGNKILAASEEKIYLIDCNNLQYRILTACRPNVINVELNDNNIIYIAMNRKTNPVTNYLISVNIDTHKEKILSQFETERFDTIELYVIRNSIYYGVHNRLEYKFRRRITTEGIEEDASSSDVFKFKTHSERMVELRKRRGL